MSRRECIWLAAVITDEGAKVQSMHESREEARLACPSHGRPLPLDEDACASLAADHGTVVSPENEGPDEIAAGDVLPDVWSDR